MRLTAIRRRVRCKYQDCRDVFIDASPAILLIAMILLLLFGVYKAFNRVDKRRQTSMVPAALQVVNIPCDDQGEIVTIAATSQPNDEQMIKSLPHGDLVWKTYRHESSAGKHDSCRAKGMYNGFGYGQAKDGSVPCYHSLKEIATLVSNWFDRQLSTKTVAQALCYYNTGVTTDTCNYAEFSERL